MNTLAPSPDAARFPWNQRLLLAMVTIAIAFRFWTSFCFFPLAEWNVVRLAPTFMLRAGSTPYPGLDGGPLTTWIYGPVPLLVDFPSVLGHDTISALFIAGTINLLLAIIPAALMIFSLPVPGPGTTRRDRAWALLLCLALWPNTSLQYIQADNTALACGLLANLLLLRAGGGHRTLLLAGAAVFTALAIWSKQTSLGLVPAQLLWLGFTATPKVAGRYALLCTGCCLGLGAIFTAWFGFNELWLNLVRIPGSLPFCESVLARTRDFWLHLSGYVVLPAVGLIVGRRHVWRRESPWFLPALTWLCLLPTGLMSTYKIGGATNSLSGFLYLLPVAALAAGAGLHRLAPRRSQAWLAAGVLAILTQQLASSPVLPLRPLTAHLVEAEQLALAYPGQIYFPWHPLVTFFSEHRFYHAEDGLSTRQSALGRIDLKGLRRDLPPSWSITAIPGWRSQGAYTQLQPPDARLSFLGKWSLYTWPRPPDERK